MSFGLEVVQNSQNVAFLLPNCTVFSAITPLSAGSSTKWHVVYTGTRPGVYSTYIEAAIHYVEFPARSTIPTPRMNMRARSISWRAPTDELLDLMSPGCNL
ncbi:hypothetical protein BDZ89DRAFT_1038405 [Hymenopellis radicata]|nr:hypothetical protein BDZ89DRAFT_1038405 [Hymenopellis radicata]